MTESSTFYRIKMLKILHDVYLQEIKEILHEVFKGQRSILHERYTGVQPANVSAQTWTLVQSWVQFPRMLCKSRHPPASG